MLCKEHRSYISFGSVSCCKSCGNETDAQAILCERCSEGLGQCSICLKALNSKVDKRKQSIYQHDRAVELRLLMWDARRLLSAADSEANRTLQLASEPANSQFRLLKRAIAEKFRVLRQPCREQYQAQASKLQQAIDHPGADTCAREQAQRELDIAVVRWAQSCHPLDEQEDAELEAAQANYDEKVAPLKQKYDEAYRASCETYRQTMSGLNAEMNALYSEVAVSGFFARWLKRILKFLGGSVNLS